MREGVLIPYEYYLGSLGAVGWAVLLNAKLSSAACSERGLPWLRLRMLQGQLFLTVQTSLYLLNVFNSSSWNELAFAP